MYFVMILRKIFLNQILWDILDDGIIMWLYKSFYSEGIWGFIVVIVVAGVYQCDRIPRQGEYKITTKKRAISHTFFFHLEEFHLIRDKTRH